MNSSPELPLFFLFLQLAIAVVLLHAAALVTSKVEIPKLDLKTAKKVLPVTMVNVVGLLFNILCLRGVEASFFQVTFYSSTISSPSLTSCRSPEEWSYRSPSLFPRCTRILFLPFA